MGHTHLNRWGQPLTRILGCVAVSGALVTALEQFNRHVFHLLQLYPNMLLAGTGWTVLVTLVSLHPGIRRWWIGVLVSVLAGTGFLFMDWVLISDLYPGLDRDRVRWFLPLLYGLTFGSFSWTLTGWLVTLADQAVNPEHSTAIGTLPEEAAHEWVHTVAESYTAPFPHWHALVVGVGADLPVTVNDAMALAELLKDPRRCGYPEKQVELLIRGKATRGAILGALDRLTQHCQGDDEATVIVFYSGHGGYVRIDGVEQYILCPYRYDSRKPRDTAILGTEFVAKVRAIDAKRVLVLLDCCHAGGFGQIKGEFKEAPMPPELEGRLKEGSGRAIIASCRKAEVSLTGNRYSVFTGVLLEGLEGANSKTDAEVVELMDVVGWVGKRVPELTAGAQNLVLDFAQVTAQFPLAHHGGWDRSSKRSVQPPPQAPIPPDAGTPSTPSVLEFITALCSLTDAEFETIFRQLGYQPAAIAGDSLHAQANHVHFLAKRDEKLVELKKLILYFNPRAFGR